MVLQDFSVRYFLICAVLRREKLIDMQVFEMCFLNECVLSKVTPMFFALTDKSTEADPMRRLEKCRPIFSILTTGQQKYTVLAWN